jgi:hypothetical protein
VVWVKRIGLAVLGALALIVLAYIAVWLTVALENVLSS